MAARAAARSKATSRFNDRGYGYIEDWGFERDERVEREWMQEGTEWQS